MKEVWNFLLGCLVGAALVALTVTYPVYVEKEALKETLNRVTIELGDRDIVIDWNNLLKKD